MRQYLRNHEVVRFLWIMLAITVLLIIIALLLPSSWFASPACPAPCDLGS